MTSKVITDSERTRVLEDFLPASPKTKSASSEPTAEAKDVQPEESAISSGNNRNGYSIDTKDTTIAKVIEEAVQTEPKESAISIISKRTSSKQRKESLEEYREAFLQVPKLDDRKPVFVSREVRDKLDEIVRKLGGRKMSVSGFIENLAMHHLEIYNEDFEVWKKL